MKPRAEVITLAVKVRLEYETKAARAHLIETAKQHLLDWSMGGGGDIGGYEVTPRSAKLLPKSPARRIVKATDVRRVSRTVDFLLS